MWEELNYTEIKMKFEYFTNIFFSLKLDITFLFLFLIIDFISLKITHVKTILKKTVMSLT